MTKHPYYWFEIIVSVGEGIKWNTFLATHTAMNRQFFLYWIDKLLTFIAVAGGNFDIQHKQTF